MSGRNRKGTAVSLPSNFHIRLQSVLRLTFFPLSVWILDRITKLWVLQTLKLGESVEVFSFPPVALTHHWNTGIAFGLLSTHQLLILAINCVIISFVILFYIQSGRKHFWNPETIGMSFIVGGALGNLFDRFYYRAVIDFIDFKVWPVFNLADSFICLGAFLIILTSFYRLSARSTKKTV